MIYEDWHLNAWLDCKLVDAHKLAEFFVAKNTLLKENEDLL